MLLCCIISTPTPPQTISHISTVIGGKSGKDKKATATTELQTFDPYISPSDGDDTTYGAAKNDSVSLVHISGFWQTIPMNIQLR